MAKAKKTTLSDIEMLRLDLGNAKEEAHLAKVQVKEKEVQRLRVLAANYKLQADLVEGNIRELMQERTSTRAVHVEFVTELKKQLGVKDNQTWGFDPETGEVTITSIKE